MVLSKACTYGLLASFYVADKRNAEYVSIREMSDDLSISFHFLTKILQKLTAAGLMISHKGPKGGVSLSRPASTINLFEIITAIDGHDIFIECILGLPGCGHLKPCPIHAQWANIRSEMQRIFSEKTLADSTEKLEEYGFRLKLR